MQARSLTLNSHTGRRSGALEAVTATDTGVLAALRALFEIREAPRLPRLFWPHRVQKIRAEFRAVYKAFLVQDLGFQLVEEEEETFYSRHGVLWNRSFYEDAGCWQSLSTARIYLQDGLANLASIRCSAATKENLIDFDSFAVRWGRGTVMAI